MRESAASGCLPGRAPKTALAVAVGAVFAVAALAGARRAAAAPPAPEPDGDPRQPAVEAETSTVGRVSYAAARAEVPLAPHAALLPAAELLYLAPVAGDPETESELHPQVGAGVAFERGPDLDFELAFSYGPRAAGVASFGMSADASWGLGAARAPSEASPLELDASLNVVRFVWSDGPATSGPAVTQVFADGSVLLRLASDLYLRGRAMLFVYEGAITPADTDEVLRLGILARVGTYAPRGLAGARLTWRAHRELAPLFEANEIVYAGGVGSGSELEAGARVDFRGGARFTLAAGVLHNHLRGVAAELPDPRTVPIVKTSFEISF
jgi:hypothetical protein